MPSVHSQKITPFLWFDSNAEEAAAFYTAVFKDSRITMVTRYGDSGPGPKGSAMTVAFELAGQKFTALNGGPHFKFTEAISFVVSCDSQAEIDEYWERLTADGGKPVQCGWLKDKFGLSWQIVPSILPELLTDHDKSERVMKVLMEMGKLNIARLQEAADSQA
ncbi:MAG: VOC family protein [Phycisphaeraceae bacterium]|nr:VOC family protein [Phycisphaeraceae bacterium]